MSSTIISTESDINAVASKFVATAFKTDNNKPVLEEAHRTVRTKEKDNEGNVLKKTIAYRRPVLAIDPLAYAAALAVALSEVKTQRIEKNTDGTERKVESSLLADQIAEQLNDVAEDAYETFGTKGDGAGYFRSFVVGVRSNRDTEKSLTVKLNAIQKEALELIMAINSGDWTSDKAELFGVPDKAAANTKSTGLLQSYAQLKAKLEAIVDAKAKREAAKEAAPKAA